MNNICMWTVYPDGVKVDVSPSGGLKAEFFGVRGVCGKPATRQLEGCWLCEDHAREWPTLHQPVKSVTLSDKLTTALSTTYGQQEELDDLQPRLDDYGVERMRMHALWKSHRFSELTRSNLDLSLRDNMPFCVLYTLDNPDIHWVHDVHSNERIIGSRYLMTLKRITTPKNCYDIEELLNYRTRTLFTEVTKTIDNLLEEALKTVEVYEQTVKLGQYMVEGNALTRHVAELGGPRVAIKVFGHEVTILGYWMYGAVILQSKNPAMSYDDQPHTGEDGWKA